MQQSGETVPRWACVRSKSQREEWARDNLLLVGHEVFLPTMSVRRRDRGSGRYVMAQIPLFSTYMFIQHTPGAPWRKVRGVPGIGVLLMHGFVPQYARVGVVEMLQATEEARRNPAPEPRWEPGAACTIDEGPFRGHEGAVVKVRGASAIVGIFLFGALRDVAVPLDSLLPRGH